YRRRTLDDYLDELVQVAPAIAVEGPKGVGKTATARRRATSAWMLVDEDQRALLSADPSLSRMAAGTILIDEWQRLPQVWDAVRRQVDDQAPPGRFLLTGSGINWPTPGLRCVCWTSTRRNCLRHGAPIRS